MLSFVEYLPGALLAVLLTLAVWLALKAVLSPRERLAHPPDARQESSREVYTLLLEDEPRIITRERDRTHEPRGQVRARMSREAWLDEQLERLAGDES